MRRHRVESGDAGSIGPCGRRVTDQIRHPAHALFQKGNPGRQPTPSDRFRQFMATLRVRRAPCAHPHQEPAMSMASTAARCARKCKTKERAGFQISVPRSYAAGVVLVRGCLNGDRPVESAALALRPEHLCVCEPPAFLLQTKKNTRQTGFHRMVLLPYRQDKVKVQRRWRARTASLSTSPAESPLPRKVGRPVRIILLRPDSQLNAAVCGLRRITIPQTSHVQT